MSRYTVQEILYLRESPLVTKPDGLPPTEQWMGPPVEVNQRKPAQTRTKIDELSTNDSSKRPTLLDTHLSRRSTTAAENIVLGPPKIAFASSNSTRTLGKTTALETADTENQRPIIKPLIKDQDLDERDADRRGSKLGGINGRRAPREDREDWNTRTRRTFEGDDNERRPRRNGDREREGQRWDQRGQKDEEGEGRFSQRHSQGRGKFDQPWFRGENGGEQVEDHSKSQARPRAWGRDRRPGAAGDEWNSRTEQDPEWMDAVETEDPKQAHTAEDFQKWKERMRADTEKRAAPEDVRESNAGSLPMEEKPAAKLPQLNIKPESDKFFELFGGEKVPDESTAAMEAKKHKTRFAALFSPAAEPPKSAVEMKPQEPAPEQPLRPASTDADQQGFQRILQMLGGKSKNSAFAIDALMNATSPGERSEQAAPNPLGGLFGGENFSKSEAPRSTESKSQNRSSGGLESLLGPRSPKAPIGQRGDSAPNRDSEFLLRLMQQSKISSPGPQQPPNQGPQSNHIPGILQMPENMNRTRQPLKSPGNGLSGFFDDPAIANTQRLQTQQEGHDIRQRHAGRPQLPNEYEQYPPRPEFIQSPQERGNGHPGMMQRPPGFDGMQPSMPWPNHVRLGPPLQPGQQPPNNHGPLSAPPGIPNPASRGMSFQGGPMPHNMNMPPPPNGPPQERQRKYTGGSGQTGPPFPPGMGPPPGFMGMPGGGNGPPPGFPPMPMGNDGMLGLGQQGVPGMPGGQQGMPPRHLMDLFAMSERGGGGPRGPVGGGIPGPYR